MALVPQSLHCSCVVPATCTATCTAPHPRAPGAPPPPTGLACTAQSARQASRAGASHLVRKACCPPACRRGSRPKRRPAWGEALHARQPGRANRYSHNPFAMPKRSRESDGSRTASGGRRVGQHEQGRCSGTCRHSGGDGLPRLCCAVPVGLTVGSSSGSSGSSSSTAAAAAAGPLTLAGPRRLRAQVLLSVGHPASSGQRRQETQGAA